MTHMRYKDHRCYGSTAWRLPLLALGMLTLSSIGCSNNPGNVEIGEGDRIIFLGNTLAERMQLFNHFETLLTARYAKHNLTFRNLGWSGDTVTLQPRPLNFGTAKEHLERQRADVIFAFFGLNESFEGQEGLDQFTSDLDAYVKSHLDQQYNGHSTPRVVLVSPIAHERLDRLPNVDVEVRNRELARYTDAIRRIASGNRVGFIDLYTPTLRLMESRSEPLTINGIHLNEEGDRLVAEIMLEAMGVNTEEIRVASENEVDDLESLREVVRDKNQQFFYRWRPVNAEYVFGRRAEPFGVENFPDEMRKLDEIVAEREQIIWDRAQALGPVRYPAES